MTVDVVIRSLGVKPNAVGSLNAGRSHVDDLSGEDIAVFDTSGATTGIGVKRL